jgi:hypothetical protein
MIDYNPQLLLTDWLAIPPRLLRPENVDRTTPEQHAANARRYRALLARAEQHD